MKHSSAAAALFALVLTALVVAPALMAQDIDASATEQPADPTPRAAVPAAPDMLADVVPSVEGDATVQRGRYLVALANCGQCHTPRNADGDLLNDQWLEGAPVPSVTPQGYPQWAYKAPRIAGLPQHTDAEFVTLMTTGINRDGKKTMAPMPEFRLSKEDAETIAAYLRAVRR
ncbi:MAG: c-type cytochrome [Acidobacteriota bacterium]